MGICQTNVLNKNLFELFHLFSFSEDDFQIMTSVFDKQKESCLAGLDLSRKGSIDTPILRLTEFINNDPAMFSLSSCSGRVVLLRESEDLTSGVRKSGCDWLLVSHHTIDFESQVSSLLSDRDRAVKGCLVLKFEPFVLHVQCRDLATARRLCCVATGAGFRNSGITVSKNGKTVTAVRSTHGLEVPLTDDQGEDLVSQEYVRFVVKKANFKMEENLKRIERFERDLFSEFSPRISPDTEDDPPSDRKEKLVYRRKNKPARDKSKSLIQADIDVLDDFTFPG